MKRSKTIVFAAMAVLVSAAHAGQAGRSPVKVFIEREGTHRPHQGHL